MRQKIWSAVLVLIFLTLVPSIQAQEDKEVFNKKNFPPVKVAEKAMECLVTVQSVGLPFAGFSVLNPYQRTISEMGGTGFIVRSDGYIITSPSVVKDAKMLTVKHKGQKYDAEVKLIDGYYDIALLKINAKGLPAVKWGDSDKVKQGMPVVVTGAPAGVERSLTYGFVTNIRDFRVTGPRGYDGMLILNGFVIDAALHAGMESAPVFGPDAEMIGMVSRKGTGGVENIGYAIPSNLVKNIVDQMINEGRVCHPWLGIFPHYQYDRPLALYMGIPIDEIDPETGRKFDVVGVLVFAVAETSPAAEVGIQRGDLILRADGKLLRTIKDLETIILNKQCGSKVDFVIVRNFELRYVTITIGNKQEEYGNIYMLSWRVSI